MQAQRDVPRPSGRAGVESDPGFVLPEQVFAAFNGGAALQPEKRLMLAVLEDGVASYQRHALTETPAGRAEFYEAVRWLRRNDEHWPFSFLNVCRTLGLEPTFIRRGLSSWRMRQTALPAAEREHVRAPFRRMNGTRTRTRSPAPGLRLVG
jgi:hypothetical protein